MSNEQLAARELAGYLTGVASLCRSWPNAGLWGRPEEAELVASYCEQASALLSAPTRDGEVGRKVRAIVDLYFEPWGAAKAAQWEDLSGDRRFSAENALSLILAALATQAEES